MKLSAGATSSPPALDEPLGDPLRRGPGQELGPRESRVEGSDRDAVESRELKGVEELLEGLGHAVTLGRAAHDEQVRPGKDIRQGALDRLERDGPNGRSASAIVVAMRSVLPDRLP